MDVSARFRGSLQSSISELRPRRKAGFSSNSAFAWSLVGLLTWLLSLLLPRVLAGLLTLLVWLIAFALLRLALVVLAHVNLQMF